MAPPPPLTHGHTASAGAMEGPLRIGVDVSARLALEHEQDKCFRLPKRVSARLNLEPGACPSTPSTLISLHFYH